MEDHFDKRIGFILERTTRIAKLSFTKAFKKMNVDITPEQWIVIDTLHKQGAMHQKDIGLQSFKNAPTISRIVDNLVRKGFVERSTQDEDRRKTLIVLTEEGKQVVDKCTAEVAHIRKLSWVGLSDDDYLHFKNTIDMIFDNLSNYQKS